VTTTVSGFDIILDEQDEEMCQNIVKSLYALTQLYE
jgi:hypothetical protein